MKKHYIKKAVSYSMVGSLGFTVVASLQGCGVDDAQVPPQTGGQQAEIADAAEQGLFLVIQQTGTSPDTYELKEKYPSSEGTRAILKQMDGSERILSENELKELAQAEAQRFEEGDSQLAQPTAENQGLSLGETILASAAGALIGGMIANKLMGNSNYQQHQQQQNQKARSSVSSTKNPAQSKSSTGGANKSQPKSGFFGGNKGNPSNRSGGSSFGG